MNHLVVVFATLVAATAIVSGNEFLCDIPTAGCANGMFDQVNCTCTCIPPFCPDALGNCVVSGTCEDPWKNCERGKDCPWWPNPLKAESCTTGPKIPDGTWKIFHSEEICCKSSFPYSEFCTPETAPPTKHPSIAFLEDDDEEIVSIQFVASNVPENVPAGSIESEMEIVLKRIILRVAEKIDGMKVTKVEAANMSLNLRRQLGRERNLSKEVTKYFLVYVIRDDDKQFGPYIINEIRDSYDDMLTQIQSFSDTKYLRGDLGLNFCTLYDGEYDLCAVEEIITDAPSPVVPETSAILQPETDDVGLAGWAIALIVVLALSILCCGGYAIAVLCCGVENFFKEQDDAKDMQSNMYMDKRLGPSESASRLAIMDGMSKYSRNQLTMQGTMRSQYSKQITQGSRIHPDSRSGVQVICSNPQYPVFDDTFTINTYSTNRRQTRDPTMFISGQESKPDPGTAYSQSQGYTYDAGSSRRCYSEAASMKPKRDPTMYMDGKAFAIDPTHEQKRDPSLCDGGQQNSVIGDAHSGYPGCSMRYDLEAIDDDVEYVRSCLYPKTVRSQVAYSRDGHDTLRGSSSCQTQEQSTCAKSMKSKTSRRSDKRHRDPSFRASDSNAPDGKSDFSKLSSHKSKMSKNTSPSSGVFSG